MKNVLAPYKTRAEVYSLFFSLSSARVSRPRNLSLKLRSRKISRGIPREWFIYTEENPRTRAPFFSSPAFRGRLVFDVRYSAKESALISIIGLWRAREERSTPDYYDAQHFDCDWWRLILPLRARKFSLDSTHARISRLLSPLLSSSALFSAIRMCVYLSWHGNSVITTKQCKECRQNGIAAR